MKSSDWEGVLLNDINGKIHISGKIHIFRVITVLRLGFIVTNILNIRHLVPVPSEAAALHGAGVEVALVVELEAGEAGVQLVEDRGQAAPQGQQLGAGAVEADTHGALQGQVPSVPQ